MWWICQNMISGVFSDFFGTNINCCKEKEHPKSKYSFAKGVNDFSFDLCPFFQKYFHHYEEDWFWNFLRDNILAFLKDYIL